MDKAQPFNEGIFEHVLRVGYPQDMVAWGGWACLVLSIWFTCRNDRKGGFEWLILASTAFLLSAALRILFDFVMLFGLSLNFPLTLSDGFEYIGGTLLFPTFGMAIATGVYLWSDGPQPRCIVRYWILIPIIALFDLLLILMGLIVWLFNFRFLIGR